MEKKKKEIDIVKIYIFAMSILSLITFMWLIYNIISVKKYSKKIQEGVEDLKRILELEAKRPPKNYLNNNQTVENVFQFFKRSVHGLPELPEVEEGTWEPGNINGALFSEKRYIIRFKNGISRRDLARYIYKIQELKPFLKVKSLEIQKKENVPPYIDKWKAEIVFAYRKPRSEE